MLDKKKPFKLSVNQILLYEYMVDCGPYRQAAFASLIDADYTDQAGKILNEDFYRYLNLYFEGWKLTRTIELFPGKERPNRRGVPYKIVTAPYKVVRYVLEFSTDADAETASRHLRSKRSVNISKTGSLQGPPYPFKGPNSAQ